MAGSYSVLTVVVFLLYFFFFYCRCCLLFIRSVTLILTHSLSHLELACTRNVHIVVHGLVLGLFKHFDYITLCWLTTAQSSIIEYFGKQCIFFSLFSPSRHTQSSTQCTMCVSKRLFCLLPTIIMCLCVSYVNDKCDPLRSISFLSFFHSLVRSFICRIFTRYTPQGVWGRHTYALKNLHFRNLINNFNRKSKMFSLFELIILHTHNVYICCFRL